MADVEITAKPSKRQQRRGWQIGGAGPAPDTVDSGARGVGPIEQAELDAWIWRLRTTDCLSLDRIAAITHRALTTVNASLDRSIAQRTLRLAGETDGWRMAQTERYAAMRAALSRIMVDPASEPKAIIEAVKALATVERDIAKLWGLQVQTGRDALAEAVADVVKARVKHGQQQRRDARQDADAADGQAGQSQRAQQLDIEGKKTNRAGVNLDGHCPSPPESPLKVLAPDLSEREVIDAELLVEAQGDLVFPELPPDKGPPTTTRHRMVIPAKVRAVLSGRLPTREPLGPSDLGAIEKAKRYRSINGGGKGDVEV